jgi:ketol-acid reductoisomerase
MEELTADIESGRFADEWDAERDAGYPNLARLKEEHAGPMIRALEEDMRSRLGPAAAKRA